MTGNRSILLGKPRGRHEKSMLHESRATNHQVFSLLTTLHPTLQVRGTTDRAPGREGAGEGCKSVRGAGMSVNIVEAFTRPKPTEATQ